jgi:hypothetical protein
VKTPVASLRDASAAAVAELFERALADEKATLVVRRLATVEFQCRGITGMNRWKLLAPISGGTIQVAIEPTACVICYALSFTLVFWFSLAATAAFWVFDHMAKPTLETAYPFLFLFGGSVALSMYRFRGFINRTITSQAAT